MLENGGVLSRAVALNERPNMEEPKLEVVKLLNRITLIEFR
jgi:hypothetical protein